MTSFCKTPTLAWRGTFLMITMLCLAILTGFRTSTPTPPRERPLRGNYEGSITLPLAESVQHITFTAAGVATHLGQFGMVNVADIVLSTFSSTGTTTFTAANGDELYTTYTSWALPNNDGTLTVTADHSITGGTGRFAEAGGSFKTTSLATVYLTMETATLSGKVYMEGTISY